MKQFFKTLMFSLLIFFTCCNTDDISVIEEEEVILPNTSKILALGDSYTIGQSVCESCRFPEQLKDSLQLVFSAEDTFNLQIIAQTGWTTNNLKTAIASESLTTDYDLVILLIGVNNQFQGTPFSVYETEFPELIQTAITAAQGDKNNVVVLSIPDYAFTPFGQYNENPETISEEIDMYNAFAESYCQQENITFLNITDITRQGLENPALVAVDGLHPSETAYSNFVARLLPIAIEKIE